LPPSGENTIYSGIKEEPLRKKGDYLFVAIVIALALIVRFVYLIEIKDHPLFNVLLADGHFHDAWAMDILNGDWLSLEKGVLYKPPLYPYFLALVYAVFGHNLFISRLVQIFIALAAYILVYRLAAIYFDRTVARIALVGTVFYGTFIYFEGELEIVVLVVTLNLLLLFLVTGNLLQSTRPRWLFTGIVLGFSALARPTLLLFIPFVLLWLFIVFRQQGVIKKFAESSLFFLLGTVLIISPVTIRNSMLGEKFVPISSNAGINFYIGNNPNYDETTSIQPGIVWERLTREPSVAAGRDLTVEEAQSYWFARSRAFIFSEPMSFLALVLKKTALFWHSYEIKRNKDIYFFKRYSTVLNLPLLTFGIVAPLALIGMLIGLSRWRNYLLLYFYVLYVMASTVIFFVTARYRIPAVPVLIMFAGYSLHWFYQRVRVREGKKAGIFMLSFLVLLFLINYDFFDVKEKSFARSHYNLGLVYSTTKQHDRAVEEFKKALELNPPKRLENAETHLNLAISYKQKGEYGLAAEEGKKALSILPDYARAYRILSEIYYETEMYDEAIDALNDSLVYESKSYESYRMLGKIYYRQERYEDAKSSLKKILSLNPVYAEAYYNLGMISYREGKLLEAKKHLKMAIKIKPDYREAHYNLGVINDEMGLLDEAIESYKMTIELDPANYKAHNNLGTIYGRKNLFSEAKVQFEKALEIKPGDKEATKNLRRAREKLSGR
jgi:tetratricopeptide (TPR) repeat protein